MNNNDKQSGSHSIDELISEALKSDEKDFIENYKNDPSLIEFVAANLKGKMAWLGWMTFIFIDILLILGVFFGYKAFHACDAKEAILWASGSILCYIGIVSLKLWSWIVASRRSTLREIKRLELQVAKLTTFSQ